MRVKAEVVCDWETGFALRPIVHDEEYCLKPAVWRIGGSEGSLHDEEDDHNDVCEEHLVPMLNAFWAFPDDEPMLRKLPYTPQYLSRQFDSEARG